MYSQKIKEKKFAWGGRVLVAPLNAAGTVSIVGSIGVGSPIVGNSVLAEVHAAMLLEGTQSRTKREIQETLDRMGGSLSFFATPSRLMWSAKVRKAHLHTMLALIKECVAEPSFLDSELTVVLARKATALSLEEKDTFAQSGILLTNLLYTQKHPNKLLPTDDAREELKKITRADLEKFHTTVVSKKSLMMALAGNLQPKKTFTLVEIIFGVLPSKIYPTPLYPAGKLSSGKIASKYIAEKASIDYMIGVATGLRKNSKEYPALLLGMQVLGNRGGFTGRLMTIVREQEGLTYGIYSTFAGLDNNADGYLYIWATFAPQLFEKGRLSTKREIFRIAQEGITKEELQKHKQLFNARFRVQLSNTGAYAFTLHTLAAEERKVAYLDELLKKISSITLSEVNVVLKKYLKHELLSEVAAGPVEKKSFKA